MESKLKRWRRHNAVERRLLLRAWIGLLVCDLGLRTLPFPLVRRWAARLSRRDGAPPVDPSRMAELVAIAGRNHLYPMTCLRLALVLQRLIGRQGVPSTLRIGVRKSGDEMDAHAWLEADGRTLDPSGQFSDFAVLQSGPGEAGRPPLPDDGIRPKRSRGQKQ